LHVEEIFVEHAPVAVVLVAGRFLASVAEHRTGKHVAVVMWCSLRVRLAAVLSSAWKLQCAFW
jgi:hypothetical protein